MFSDQSMKFAIVILAGLFFLLTAFYYFTGYRSAFEADQACHSDIYLDFEESSLLDCDHDIETNQWILFQTSKDHLPSKVIRRYRY